MNLDINIWSWSRLPTLWLLRVQGSLNRNSTTDESRKMKKKQKLHGHTRPMLGSSSYLPASWPGNAREISSDKIPKEDKIQEWVSELTNPPAFLLGNRGRENARKLCISPGNRFYSWMIGFPEENNETNHVNYWLKNHSLISNNFLLLQFRLGNHVNIYCCITPPIVIEDPPNMKMWLEASLTNTKLLVCFTYFK